MLYITYLLEIVKSSLRRAFLCFSHIFPHIFLEVSAGQMTNIPSSTFEMETRLGRVPPLMALFPSIFTPFFLLQLNLTYVKRILHFKYITFIYKWFKIDIHQQLQPLTANYLVMFKVISTSIYT